MVSAAVLLGKEQKTNLVTSKCRVEQTITQYDRDVDVLCYNLLHYVSVEPDLQQIILLSCPGML